MIPSLVDGVLPEGLYECKMDEVESCFGAFQRSDQRVRLTDRLRAFIEEARRTGIVMALILDGSYVTACEEPNDIDLILVLQPDFDLNSEIRPFQYNIISKRRVRKHYGFDLFPMVEGSAVYPEILDFFSRVRPDAPYTGCTRKGLLRIQI